MQLEETKNRLATDSREMYIECVLTDMATEHILCK
jgi:hypothetical protein